MDRSNAREIFKKNLARIMALKRINQTDIVSSLEVTASTVSDWVLGKKYPRVDTMQRLADYLGVPMSTLTTDIPNTNNASNDWSDPLVEAYATAPRPKQDAVCVMLDIPYVKPGELPEEEVDAEPFRVSEQAAAAGTGFYLGPEEFRTIQVVEGCLPQNANFGVPVSGDSMEPNYHDGDILIVSKEKAQYGQVGVFTMDGQGYVKILRSGYLESLNPEYEDIPMTDDTICNGAVIGVLGKDCIVEE